MLLIRGGGTKEDLLLCAECCRLATLCNVGEDTSDITVIVC